MISLQEIFALGICNTIPAFLTSFAVAASLSRTAIQESTGKTSIRVCSWMFDSTSLPRNQILHHFPETKIQFISRRILGAYV